MSRRVVTMSVGAAMLLVLGVLGAQLPVPYAALGPGPTLNTLGSVGNQEIVSIDGRASNKTAGHLNLTTVSVQDHLDLLTAVRGWLAADVAVVPREEIYPPGRSEAQIERENSREFSQSQSNAVLAALGELNYPKRVVVQGLVEGSASRDKLRAGDVLVRLDGTAVATLEGLQAQLTALAPGTAVAVDYLRGHATGRATVTLGRAKERAGGALGVLVEMNPVATDFTVSIKVGEQIGGPSAGLMFALGILEKIGPQELTGGAFIAGTGTIDSDGKVGPIGGIPLKMIGARDKGATVFLVPAANCDEASRTTPAGLRLVRVDTLHGAVVALRGLQAGVTPPAC
ncbi:MAG: PDZ domain-containing protein [Actinobacteria bacterium]|nr:PDZ domain-containing protein [Actinomycetota bacterium]MBI3688574.1 PDZ domain-containing protein [Actinomycetota bacterium]